MIRILFIMAFLFCSVVNVFGTEYNWFVKTPKGDFYVKEVIYVQESREWHLKMSNIPEGPYFEALLPVDWVKLYNNGIEVTEKEALKWERK